MAEPSSRPNMLVIMCDQLRADQLGCYGNTVVRTPHLDHLASRSTQFDHFYVNNPLCQPNRATLMTGQMPSVNGVRQNGIPLSLQSVTYAEVLRQQGYQTGYVGKAHLQNVTSIPAPKRQPWGLGQQPIETQSRRDQRQGADYQCESRDGWLGDSQDKVTLPYYGFEKAALCVGHGDQVVGHYRHWIEQQVVDANALIGPGNSLDPSVAQKPQCWHTAVPEHLYPSAYVAKQAKDFIRNRQSEQPFLLVASFPDPHHPFTPPGQYAHMYKPEDMPLPASFDHKVKHRTDLPEALLATYAKGDADPNKYWPFHIDAEHLRQVLALCYGAISNIDYQIGQILATLKAEGLSDSTQIVFVSDHGDYMGDHGTLLKSGLHSQGVLRVPLLWFDPNRSASVTHTQASAIDFAPTLLQQLGSKVPVGMQGGNMLSCKFSAAPILVEDAGVGIYTDPDQRSAQLTLVDGPWRITMLEGAEWGELYHLEEDPNELSNLWGLPNYGSVKAKLMFRLAQRQLALRDLTLSASAQA